MAKILWEFIGVTYENANISVREEIDSNFSKSDAERLCKSRYGFKEIRVSHPISYPVKDNTSIKTSGNSAQDSGEGVLGILLIIGIWIAYITFERYYLQICFFIGFIEAGSLGGYFLRKEKIFANNAIKKILIYFGSLFFGITFGIFFQTFENQEWYLKLIPIFYVIFRLTIGKYIYDKFLDNLEHNIISRGEKKTN